MSIKPPYEEVLTTINGFLNDQQVKHYEDAIIEIEMAFNSEKRSHGKADLKAAKLIENLIKKINHEITLKSAGIETEISQVEAYYCPKTFCPDHGERIDNRSSLVALKEQVENLLHIARGNKEKIPSCTDLK